MSTVTIVPRVIVKLSSPRADQVSRLIESARGLDPAADERLNTEGGVKTRLEIRRATGQADSGCAERRPGVRRKSTTPVATIQIQNPKIHKPR